MAMEHEREMRACDTKFLRGGGETLDAWKLEMSARIDPSQAAHEGIAEIHRIAFSHVASAGLILCG